MAISRGQIPKQIEGKLRGARGEKKKKKNKLNTNPIAKSLRTSKFNQKVVQSKKLYNRKKDNNGYVRDYSI